MMKSLCSVLEYPLVVLFQDPQTEQLYRQSGVQVYRQFSIFPPDSSEQLQSDAIHVGSVTKPGVMCCV